MPLTARTVPERSRSQGRPSEAALAGLPLDGGESGGKSAGGSGVGVFNVVRRETTLLPAWLCFEWLLDSLAFQGYGPSFLHQGRFAEGESAIRRALETDPLSPLINTFLGLALILRRHYDAAEKQLLKTLEWDPNFPDALASLATTEWQSGKQDDAIGRFEKAFAASGGDVRMRCSLAAYKAFAGCKEEALAHLEVLLSLADKRYVSPVHLSQVYSGLGELDKACDLLEKGFQDREPVLRILIRLPAFDVLRPHPRFQDLLRRIGIQT